MNKGGQLAYLKEEIKAGLIIVISLVILSGFVILISGTQYFKEFDVYYVKVMNAAGLEPGSQVRLGGVRVGRITGITPPAGPGEPVVIAIGVNKNTVLYKGTLAFISQTGFVGDIFLQLAVDKTSGERLRPGDTIPSTESVNFNIIMAKIGLISESLEVLIKDVDKLFSQENIQEIEKAVKNTTLALREIRELAQNSKDEISKVTVRAGEDLDKAGDMIKAIEQAAKAMEQTARTVDTTAKSAGEAIDFQSKNITVLITNLSDASEDLREALQEIKNKPWSVIYPEGKKGDE